MVFFGCENGKFYTNDVLVALVADPDTKEVTELTVSLRMDRYNTTFAMCNGDDPPLPAAPNAFAKEQAAANAVHAVWLAGERGVDPDFSMFAEEFAFCADFEWRPCITLDEFKELMSPSLLNSYTAVLERTILSHNHVWLTYVDVFARSGKDAPVFSDPIHILLDINPHTGKVVRMQDVLDKANAEAAMDVASENLASSETTGENVPADDETAAESQVHGASRDKAALPTAEESAGPLLAEGSVTHPASGGFAGAGFARAAVSFMLIVGGVVVVAAAVLAKSNGAFWNASADSYVRAADDGASGGLPLMPRTTADPERP